MLYYKPFVYNLINWGGGQRQQLKTRIIFKLCSRYQLNFLVYLFLWLLNLVCFFFLVACCLRLVYIYIYMICFGHTDSFLTGYFFLEYTGLIVVLWLCYSKSLTVTHTHPPQFFKVRRKLRPRHV